ncbi:MAG: hypothetical protein NUV90_00280 [Candidatus Parcubacteria bacterium]|nr:hypothetical protein [Candidatus Parcubacteria bacterium]
MQQLAYARRTPFREVFKSYVGKEVPATLSDEAIALVLVASTQQDTENDKIMGVLSSVLTYEGAPEHFKILQKMETTRGQFFTRFVLFTKTIIDGLLVGFGTDEMYYVVATWDGRGCDLWQPKHDLHDRPVLA